MSSGAQLTNGQTSGPATGPARPTEQDALDVARGVFGDAPHSIRRFPTGIGHHVYEVIGSGGVARVVRMGTPAQSADFAGAVHWSKTLRPIGIPLPELLAHGRHRDFPYVILERLPGDDLENVLTTLSAGERNAIATRVCAVQAQVGALPHGHGFGYERLPGSPLHDSWVDVVDTSIERSRSRIVRAGLADPAPLRRLAGSARRLSAYLADVHPVPFLDDITTRNVLVDAGCFSGIVDVDWICYGDPLFMVALTRAALLAAELGTEYTDVWCARLDLSTAQLEALHFYTALFCADFISEFGQTFNSDAVTFDAVRHARLESLLHANLDAVS